MSWEAAAAALALVIAAIVAGIVKLRQSKSEADKDAVAIYREMVVTLQLEHDELKKEHRQHKIDCDTEFKAVRRECEAEVRALRLEISELRKQSTVQETERIQQRTEIHELAKDVDKKLPGPETFAEIVIQKLEEREHKKDA